MRQRAEIAADERADMERSLAEMHRQADVFVFYPQSRIPAQPCREPAPGFAERTVHVLWERRTRPVGFPAIQAEAADAGHHQVASEICAPPAADHKDTHPRSSSEAAERRANPRGHSHLFWPPCKGHQRSVEVEEEGEMPAPRDAGLDSRPVPPQPWRQSPRSPRHATSAVAREWGAIGPPCSSDSGDVAA